MLTEGMPRKGRYIRKDSSTFNRLTVEEYSFENVCESKVFYPDNPRANIIFHQLHEPETLAEEIPKTDILSQDLLDVNQWVPVLRPKDFTQSWRAAKDKRQSIESFEEEEDDSLEFSPGVVSKENAADLDVMKEVEHAEITSESASLAEETLSSFKFKEAEAPVSLAAAPSTIEEVVASDPIVLSVQAISEADREALIQQGVEEGMRIAAEKFGADQATILDSLNAICKEVFQSKKELFHHMQENFVHLASSLAESLVGKELRLHPEKLAPLIHQAIEASIHDETFTICVSPEVYEKLQSVEGFQYKTCLVAKDGFSAGQFRVESATTTLESDIRKIVSELIAHSDIHILDSIEKPT